MIPAGSLEYATARMHVRHAGVPSERDWRDIEHARGLAGVLAAARETSMRPALHGLDDRADLHRVDAAVRGAWSASLAEVARWLPSRWSGVLAWCEAIPRLDAIAALARGERQARWMREDALLAALESAPPGRGHPLLPLAGAWRGEDAGMLWAHEWRRRLPPEARDDPAMPALARHVAAHMGRFAQAASHDAAPLRSSLRQRALSTFRRHGTEPAGVVAWLLLGALDLERLRGELARRAAFPEARPVP